VSGVVAPQRTRIGPVIEPAWRTETGDAPLAIAVSARGDYLAVASGDGEVLVLDSERGRIVRTWAAHAFGALSVAWSNRHDCLASGGQDGSVRFWSLHDDEPIATRSASPELDGGARVMRPWVEHVVWSPDGQTLATAAGPHVALWDASGTLIRRLPPFRSTVADLQWLPDGERLSAVGYSGAMVWHRRDDSVGDPLHWKGSFLCHAWASTGKWLAAGMQESAVHIFETRTKGDLEMSGYSQKVTRLSWSEDGKRMITNGGPYGTVWNFAGDGPAGTRPVSLGGHVLSVTDVAFFRHGLWVATCGEDGQLLIWNLTVSSQRAMAAGFVPSAALRLAWHPTDRRVFTTHQSGWVVGWPVLRG
jgi:WD40 repeat protein